MAYSRPPTGRETTESGAHPVRFGTYLLERRLAVGGTSEVYLARPASGDKPARVLVLKRLLPSHLSDPSAIGMFAIEAQLHRAVHHPNVVEVFEAGVVDGEPYLAMEYIDGVDAFRLLRRAQTEERRLPEGMAIYIARCLCAALGCVHEARGDAGQPLNMIHRDVTPSNVYLSSEGDVRLGDFGIARSVLRTSRASLNPALKGKYSYLAPEQVSGEPFDHRADLFSLAVVASELILGAPLFPGAGQLAVLLSIRDGRIDALRAAASRLSLGLFDILARALARDPADRFQTAAELGAALEPFELPSREVARAQVKEWVAWARDTHALARRLGGAIRGSNERMKSLSLPPGSDPLGEAAHAITAPPPPPDEGSDAPALYPARQPASNPALHAALHPPQYPAPRLPLGLPSLADAVPDAPFADLRPPPGARGGDDDPITARFDEVPSRVQLASGRELTAPVSFARIIEMIVTGELGSEDQVDLMGQGFRRVAEIELLERHLPGSVTTQTLQAPKSPDETIALSTPTLLALLGRLSRDRETGLLLCEGRPAGGEPMARREVYLSAGTLLHVASPDAGELLGQSLVRRSVITAAELDMALAVLSRFEGRLGDTLIALGLVDAMQLFRAIEEQGRERLVRLFTWSSGRAAFYRGVSPSRVEFPLELDLAALLLAGLELALPNDAPLLEARELMTRVLRRTPGAGARLRRGSLPRPVSVLAEALGGAGMELRHVLIRLSTAGVLNPPDALRVMHVGLALGLLELA